MHNWSTGPSSRAETFGAVLASTSIGAVTTSASANTKGAWGSIVANQAGTSFAYESITVGLLVSTARDCTVDIGIETGFSPSEYYTIVEDLRLPGLRVANFPCIVYSIPVHVPAGAKLAARAQASTGSTAVGVYVIGHSAGIMGAPGYGRCIALYTPATSRGVSIDPGAVAHTKPAYTQLVASTSADVEALIVAIGGAGDIARTAADSWLIDVGVGTAANEWAVLPNLFAVAETNADWPLPAVFGPFACSIPKTSRVAARCQCNVTTAGDRVLDIGVWGLVP